MAVSGLLLNVYCAYDFRGDKVMWIPGIDIKALVDAYLHAVAEADKANPTSQPKWPCWEMNNHDLVPGGTCIHFYSHNIVWQKY